MRAVGRAERTTNLWRIICHGHILFSCRAQDLPLLHSLRILNICDLQGSVATRIGCSKDL